MPLSGGCRAALLPAVEGAEGLSTLSAAIRASPDIGELLEDEDTVATLFAPTDEAFEDALDRLGIGLEDLVEEPEVLSALLRYHLVTSLSLLPEDLRNARRIVTALEDYTLVGGSDEEIEAFASTAEFVGESVPICRSVIYLIDEVLLPEATLENLVEAFSAEPADVPEVEAGPTCREGFNAFFAISSDNSLSTFADLLNQARLSGDLAGDTVPFTVFAPTNRAFTLALERLNITLEELSEDEELLEGILKYHIIRGENWEAADVPDGRVETWNGTRLVIEVDDDVVLSGVGSGASIVEADVDMACSSAVHKISGVLLPFRPSATAAGPSRGSRGERATEDDECQVGNRDFFQVLSSTPGLTIWTQVIQLAGMRGIFSDKSISVTMFAPNDAAFGVLLPPNVGFAELVADEALAQALVSYHTIAGAAISRQIDTGIEVETLLTNKKDKPVKISIEDNPFGVVDMQIEAKASIANVVELDVVGCNSVAHVIDTVLLPYADFFPSERVELEEAVEKAEEFGSLLEAANEELADDEEEEDTSGSGRRSSARS